ncbi:MAG: DNA repair protein RecO [bacterium]|nr:DNA repair protein RecO [bacterium]
MSYHIYTTKGLILSERPTREADRIYTIMTRDLGLVRAMAIGVRKEASKLRGNIEPFSLALVSFVKGKNSWRLTSAEFIKQISSIPAIARPLLLLEKLVQGEAPHPELFDAVEDAILFYPDLSRALSREHGRGALEPHDEMFEINVVSKILFHLGYLKESDMALGKKLLIKAINDGLQNSHLI